MKEGSRTTRLRDHHVEVWSAQDVSDCGAGGMVREHLECIEASWSELECTCADLDFDFCRTFRELGVSCGDLRTRVHLNCTLND